MIDSCNTFSFVFILAFKMFGLQPLLYFAFTSEIICFMILLLVVMSSPPPTSLKEVSLRILVRLVLS